MDTNFKSSAYNRSLVLSPCRLCSRDGCKFPSTCQGDPWKCLLLLVQKADRNMYKHKREDLDRYFRYGIIMLTFNIPILIDSYKWVTKNARYSAIARVCVGHQPLDDDNLFISYDAAVAIVALWAVSFVLTSISLMMCHFNHQWLREFVNQPQFSYKNQLAFRQIHYDSLCRWDFFDKCDTIPFLLPLSATLFIAGLIVFLWQLNHPDAYVFLIVSCVLFAYYIVVALHPLYCFLTAPQDGLTSELSPFRSPSSWFFFKLFMNRFNFTNYWTLRKRALLRRGTLLPLYSQFRPPSRTRSIDWLEQDCSLFMEADNAPDFNTTLTNALLWIESNPTIEKTTKVVVSVYHCISDLHLPSILPRFKERCTGSESGLAGIIAAASQKCSDVNDPAVTAFVLKRWLELHVTRLPELRIQLVELQVHCMNEICKRMPDYARLGINSISASLIQDRRLPVKTIYLLLATARTCLEKGIYYEGTFKLIVQTFHFRDSASERQVNLVLAILAKCKDFAYSFRGSGIDKQQARQFMSELEEFLSNVQAIDCDFDRTSGHQSWSPRSSDIWKEILTIANEVYLIASLSLPGFLDTLSALPMALVNTRYDDGICPVTPVSTEKPLNSYDDGTCHVTPISTREPCPVTPVPRKESFDSYDDGTRPVTPVSRKESFDSMQFETNDVGEESATNTLTVLSVQYEYQFIS